MLEPCDAEFYFKITVCFASSVLMSDAPPLGPRRLLLNNFLDFGSVQKTTRGVLTAVVIVMATAQIHLEGDSARQFLDHHVPAGGLVVICEQAIGLARTDLG